jgi:hypothetical protein
MVHFILREEEYLGQTTAKQRHISHTVGHSTEDAKWIDHGTLLFSAPSGTRLSFLNNLIAVFKDEAPKGTSSLVKVWKWE